MIPNQIKKTFVLKHRQLTPSPIPSVANDHHEKRFSETISPESTASILSKVLYSWLNPLFLKGYRQPLEMRDIWKLGPEWQAERFESVLESAWRNHLEQLQLGNETLSSGTTKKPLKAPSFLTATWNALFWKLMPHGFLLFFDMMLSILSPLLIKFLIDYVTNSKIASATGASQPSLWQGIILALGILLIQLACTLSQNYHFQLTYSFAMTIRGALTSIIYKKSLRLSSFSRQKFNAGYVTNLISTDLSHIAVFLEYMHLVWSTPIQIIAILAFLYSQIGYAVFPGVALLILSGPLQGFLMGIAGRLRGSIAELTDKRSPFLNAIESVRSPEMTKVFRASIVTTFFNGIASVVSNLTTVISFTVYSLTSSTLDPGRIFSSLAWFSSLSNPLSFLPQLLLFLSYAKIAFQRITDLMLAAEQLDSTVLDPSAPFGIEIKNGNFEWEILDSEKTLDSELKSSLSEEIKNAPAKNPSSEENETLAEDETIVEVPGRLTNINVTIPKDKLVAVVGAVGSGKSSLLNAIVGEMKKLSGQVTLSGSVGYASQEAWIQNASIKENILFGHSMDEKRYAETIRACCLEPDLARFPDGDETQIGERGINLSGGQKQRISLARLVYFDPDIVLLDDPLSAVDAHVARHLFEECMQGTLSGKTRILVTHHLRFLPQVDLVIVMKDGQIEQMGTYAELMDKGGAFSGMMFNYGGSTADAEELEMSGQNNHLSEGAGIGELKSHMRVEDKFSPIENEAVGDSQEKKNNVRQLIHEEDRATGSVSGYVWWDYFAAGGGWTFVVGCFIMVSLVQLSSKGVNYWLVIWSNKSISSLSDGGYIGAYFGLTLFQSLLSLVVGIVFAFYSNQISRTMHHSALSRLIRAPVLFFDSTPLGRIMNRFSKDQDAIDSSVMRTLRFFLSSASASIGTFILVCLATPFFAIPLIPMMVLYYFIQLYYRTTSRELKRLHSLSMSPVFSHMGETLTGVPIIRAYGEQRRFIDTSTNLINQGNATGFLLWTASRWFSLRLETLASLLTLAATLFGIFSRGTESFDVSLWGLALSYVTEITSTLKWTVMHYSETELAMNAVERVSHYAHRVENESPALIPDKAPPASWPARGDIQFENVDMRYAPDLPLVLKQVTFSIKDNEKIGIVGRTGCGKSSLIQVLFRMVEPTAGSKIIIDGRSTLEMGLHDLRSKLGIIPQDPALFSGTFRRNLDPFDQYTDQQIWDVLERVHIKSRIMEAERGLEGTVGEGGDNLSVGQKQLICLARAMLPHPRILIMDEATANIDYETDAIIQKCLREDFKDSTIITIAHRLHTIMDYDRIMVLVHGQLVEMDSPRALLSNPQSVFYGIASETGQETMDLFFKMVGLP